MTEVAVYKSVLWYEYILALVSASSF